MTKGQIQLAGMPFNYDSQASGQYHPRSVAGDDDGEEGNDPTLLSLYPFIMYFLVSKKLETHLSLLTNQK